MGGKAQHSSGAGSIAPCRGFLSLACLFVALTPARAQSPAVTLTPSVVQAGSPVLIHVDAGPDASPNASFDADWLGRKLQFFSARAGRGWYALAGVDVEAPTGPSTLRLVVHTANTALDLTRTVQIHPAHYRTASLTVEPKFVTPGPDELKQIEAESQLKASIFASSAPQPLWTASFRRPVVAPPTDSFGTRRIFNGKLASIHKGMDFRAAPGTPVRAGNSGRVVLARLFYYEGNCVVIDHGLGLFTLSMHLSRIDVREGQQVATGDRLGLSGATGRVTGPHFHWAVRWQGAYLDPAKLLRLNLTGLR
jgi:hypothetical protein